MREFPAGKVLDAVPYIELIRQFTSGRMSAPDFETAYFELCGSDDKVLPKVIAEPINEIFYDLDDYVPDPELRAEVNGLGEETLRERVVVQLRLLVEAVTAASEKGNEVSGQSDPNRPDLG
ncbi:MAG TPA: colicin immunity domain-containing protein [Pseudonocardiaceae bacterium]